MGTWRKQPVAIKQMIQIHELTDKQIKEFKKETEIMMRLRPHSNVVALFGVCTKNMLCIVTEYLPNGNLEKYLQSHKIDNNTLLRMSKEICAGMVIF